MLFEIMKRVCNLLCMCKSKLCMYRIELNGKELYEGYLYLYLPNSTNTVTWPN
jgi:hypothetical protein